MIRSLMPPAICPSQGVQVCILLDFMLVLLCGMLTTAVDSVWTRPPTDLQPHTHPRACISYIHPPSALTGLSRTPVCLTKVVQEESLNMGHTERVVTILARHPRSHTPSHIRMYYVPPTGISGFCSM
jgi:hypothetical protein